MLPQRQFNKNTRRDSMKNIRDIRHDKNLYFILPEDVEISRISCYEDVAVIVYLYYEDSLEKYLPYVDKIPEKISIYIVSSNEELCQPTLEYIHLNKNKKIKLIRKKNRGRDISALLVACREICMEHKYFCFVHDKKKKEIVPAADFDLWIENLWGNSLAGEKYISNVLNIFETNNKIGILAPPEPIGTYMNAWYTNNSWGKINFKLACQLAKELQLNCDLDIQKSPITLGTVFWARSDALKKLFEKEWKYEDFDDEPLGEETISHAIERIFGYVAQDAGYDTGTVMRSTYGERLLSYTQENFTYIYQMFRNDYGLCNVKEFFKKRNDIYEFCTKNKNVYLYGAGIVGKRCLHLLRSGGYEPAGFIITKANCINQQIEGIAVKSLEDMSNIEDAGVIIAVGKKLEMDLEKNLILKNMKNYIKYL